MKTNEHQILASDTLAWLEETSKTVSLRLLAKEIGYSYTVLYRVIRGSYDADPTAVVEAIERYRATHEERDILGTGVPYIHTDLAAQIWQACDYARLRQQVVSIVGRTQRGKTTALRAYAQEIGVSVLMIRMPSSPSPIRICRALCKVMRLDARGSLDILSDRILGKLSSQHLIIIDEVHQCLLTTPLTGLRCIELLRELADTAECGMILCGTKVWSNALRNNNNFAPVLQQVVERGITQSLPDEVALDDIRKVWTHYGLGEPSDQPRVCLLSLAKYHGMGRLTKVMQSAGYIAAKRKTPITWEHVTAANNLIQQLGS